MSVVNKVEVILRWQDSDFQWTGLLPSVVFILVHVLFLLGFLLGLA